MIDSGFSMQVYEAELNYADRIPAAQCHFWANSPMQKRSLLIALLIAAFLISDIALVSACNPPSQFLPSIADLALYGLVFCQINFVAAWAALGNAALILQSTAGALAILGLWAILPRHSDSGAFGLLLVEQSIFVFITLLPARLAGFRVMPRAASTKRSISARAWQFSIRHILQATTLVAVLAAVIARFKLSDKIIGEATWFAAMFAAMIAAPTVPLVFAILGRSRRFLWALAALGVLATAIASLLWQSPLDRTILEALCIGQVIILVLAISVVRIAGYQLIRATTIPASNVDLQPGEQAEAE
jgi:hypothetical protein